MVPPRIAVRPALVSSYAHKALPAPYFRKSDQRDLRAVVFVNLDFAWIPAHPYTTCAPQRRRSPVKGGFTHVDVGNTW